MFPARLAALALAVGLLAVLDPASGQTTPKARPKPGAPLVADPNDLPKAGAALSPFALVQRPVPLKGVRSWTVETKRHRWAVTHLAVTPDGKRVATGGYDGVIRVWDADTGEFVRALVGHERYVYGLAWSPDGNYLAAAGGASTRVWDGKTGLCVRILKDPKQGVIHALWSPDGARLLTGGGGSGQLALWDVAAGKQLAAVEYGTPVLGMAFAPTGGQVAAATRAGTHLADAGTLKTVHSFKESADADSAVAFSPDGKRLAVGGPKAVVVHDAVSGSTVQKFGTGGTGLVWTPAGGLLVVSPARRVVPHAPTDLAPGSPLPGTAAAVCRTADGAGLFGLSAGQVTRWDLTTGQAVRTFPVGEALTPVCGPAAAVLVPGNPPALWDVAATKRIGGLDEHKGALGPVAWAPTGKALAVAAANKQVRVYDPATARSTRLVTAPAAVTGLALAADGRLACATADRKVTLWAPTGDEPRHTLAPAHRSPPLLAVSRDGRFLATAGGKEIEIWSADTGQRVRRLEHPRDVRSVAWSADGGRLVVGSSEEVALAWYQASTWKLQPAVDKGSSSLGVSAAAWSPDGATLLGHRNSAAYQWNLKTGRAGPAFGSPAPVGTLGFWPEGKTVCGGAVDRAARVWDAATGRLRLTAVFDRDQMLAVSAEGHYRIPDAADVVAVVQTDKGQESVPLKELAARYGFRNVPANVK